MLTSNSPLLNFLVPFEPPPPPTEGGCSSLELPLVVREQFFRRLVGYVYYKPENYFTLMTVNRQQLADTNFSNSCIVFYLFQWGDSADWLPCPNELCPGDGPAQVTFRGHVSLPAEHHPRHLTGSVHRAKLTICIHEFKKRDVV